MSDLSYIASILFTHVKITRQWKSTLTLICRTSSCPGRIRTKTCLGLKMYMTGFFCRFYFFNMSKIWIRNLSSSKIVQNLLQSFVFKTSEFEDCEQSLFRSKICEGSGVCGQFARRSQRAGSSVLRWRPIARPNWQAEIDVEWFTTEMVANKKTTDCLCRYIEVLLHI